MSVQVSCNLNQIYKNPCGITENKQSGNLCEEELTTQTDIQPEEIHFQFSENSKNQN